MSGLDGLLGGALAIGATALSAAAARKEARKQRDFVERMRATAYQVTMEDMRAAGLNPILAYRQGPTTAGGVGITATPGYGTAAAAGAQAAAGMTGAAASKSQAASAKELREQQQVTERQRGIALLYQARNQEAQTNLTNAQTVLTESRIPAAQATMKFDQSPTGQTAIKVHRATGGATSSAVNSARSIIYGGK